MVISLIVKAQQGVAIAGQQYRIFRNSHITDKKRRWIIRDLIPQSLKTEEPILDTNQATETHHKCVHDSFTPNTQSPVTPSHANSPPQVQSITHHPYPHHQHRHLWLLDHHHPGLPSFSSSFPSPPKNSNPSQTLKHHHHFHLFPTVQPAHLLR